MACAKPDKHLASIPDEVGEFFHYENPAVFQNPLYTQAIQHNVDHHAERDMPRPTSVYASDVKHLWTISEYDLYVPGMSIPIHNEFVSGWGQDNAIPVGPGSALNTPWSNVEGAGVDDLQHLFLPMQTVPEEVIPATSPARDHCLHCNLRCEHKDK